MSRSVSLLVLAVSVPLFAQTTRLVVTPLVPLMHTDANIEFSLFPAVRNDGALPASDVRVHFQIEGEATIQRVHPDSPFSPWDCTLAGDGKSADCTKPTIFRLPDPIPVTIRSGSGNGTTSTFTMTATSPQPAHPGADNVTRVVLQNYHEIAVVTVADRGPGSLRAAIEEANGVGKPAKIVFELPRPVPSEGWFTITPETPLPPITAQSAVLDGETQRVVTGDTNIGPEIAIDGHLAHYGLEIHSPCEARVHGLAIGNFDANQGLWFTKSGTCAPNGHLAQYREISRNYIGTDPTGVHAWPNLRGLRVDFGSGAIRQNLISGNTYSGMWVWVTEGRFDSLTIEDNVFGAGPGPFGNVPLPNGAAGILFGPRVTADVRRNIIANHPGMGIALVRGETYVDIRENSMRDNGGIGIDWGIDGVSPADDADANVDPNAPVLLAARYDPELNRTYFTMAVRSEQMPGSDVSMFDVNFYANRGPDGDGEQWIGEGFGGGERTDGSTFEVWVAGDHQGKWVNATSTRVPVSFARPPQISSEAARHGEGSTSEFSNAILVP
jgi:hypothetical protein